MCSLCWQSFRKMKQNLNEMTILRTLPTNMCVYTNGNNIKFVWVYYIINQSFACTITVASCMLID